MNEDLIKQSRNRVYRINRDSARFLKEENSEVSYVEITYTLTLSSGVCPIKPLVGHTVITPKDKLFWHSWCLNKDCTSNGFYLTDEIEKAIHLRKVIAGEKKCERKEDWKYLNSSACSCLTTLKYTITPVFKC